MLSQHRRGTLRRDDSGFTVIELVLSAALAGVVTTSLFGMLASQSNAVRRVEQASDNTEARRLAIVEVLSDLRAAEPLVAVADVDPPSPVDRQQQVRFHHQDFETGAVTALQWRFDAAAGELVREVLADGTTVSATTYRLAGVVDQPIFTYRTPAGAELTSSYEATTVASCTRRVQVTLRAAPEPGVVPKTLSSDVTLRNHRATTGCPE